MSAGPVPFVLQAIEALKQGDRRAGSELLAEELRTTSASNDRLRSVSRLAAEIGEIDLAIEAARRASEPPTLERLLTYWGTLVEYGRFAEARAEIDRQPPAVKDNAAVLHLLGAIASEHGHFEEAEALYRRALAAAPRTLQTWFALAMIKSFDLADPDLAVMDRLAGRLSGTDPALHSRFLYALAKAWDDCGEFDRAFACYEQGAAIRRPLEIYNAAAEEAFAERLSRDFTANNMATLEPSRAEVRPLFVTGLPRSGTTLVEQILAAHPDVHDGGELNLLRAALIPTRGYTLEGAIAYQCREMARGNHDPWGDIARDYQRFIDMRFPANEGRIVDKTLGHSSLMGLLLHCMPDSRVVWMRRDPEDTALSCFTTYFSSAVPWSWSLEDIARHFRVEDRLFEHWTSLFGDRILVVPYEELASTPEDWTGKILCHVGLDPDAARSDARHDARAVRTASLRQVRAPVSTAAVGRSRRYFARLEPFRWSYCG